MSERAAPQYCPYCGDEDLRPEPTSHRAWHCRACTRVFEVTFVGLHRTLVGSQTNTEQP
jgi:ribosomal protein L37AE/L43A